MKRKKLYFEALNKLQLKILKKLSFLNKSNFYLSGGTALGLQIKHRKSIDFDFYRQSNFEPMMLYFSFQTAFKKLSLLHTAKGTLIVKVENVEVGMFYYPYPLIKPLIKTKYVSLASIEDISAMKLISIIQRGCKRDFIDIYFLIKKFGLNKLFKFCKKKYKGFNEYLALKALTYFKDADEDTSRNKIQTFEKISWKNIKEELIDIVKKYNKENLM
jgi:hypothetical protein